MAKIRFEDLEYIFEKLCFEKMRKVYRSCNERILFPTRGAYNGFDSYVVYNDEMKIEELKKKMALGEDVLILDVREPEEVMDEPSVPGAVHMPMGKVFLEASQGMLPKDKNIITICRTGKRCEIIKQELSPKGFRIEALDGGMEAWRANNQI